MPTSLPNIPQGKVFLGIDHGSSSIKGLLIDSSGVCLEEFGAYPVHTDQTGAFSFEQNPLEHLAIAKKIIASALDAAIARQVTIHSMGITCQRSSVAAWDKLTGAVLHPLIIWRDSRTISQLDALSHTFRRLVRTRTALPLLPYYAAGKYALIQKQFPSIDTCIGSLDTFLLQQLAAERPFVTDHTMAARTMLYDIGKHRWCNELCDGFGVSISRLPLIQPSISHHGTISGIPVLALLGDQQAALLAVKNHTDCKLLNLGTITSTLVPTGTTASFLEGFITSIFYSEQHATTVDFKFLLEGISHAGGAVIDHIESDPAIGISRNEINALCEKLSQTSDAVWFNPIGGYATPYWSERISPFPSSLANSREEIAFALIENVAFFIASLVLELRKNKFIAVGEILACSGGLSKIPYLLQTLADVSNTRLGTVEVANAGALGAALAAGNLLNQPLQTPTKNDKFTRIFEPKTAKADKRYQRWIELRDTAISLDK